MAKRFFKDSFTLHSDRSIEETAVRLGLHIAPAPLISWRWPLPYDGEVTHTGFRAVRMIDYQNAFLPRIKGSFEALRHGTAIHITMAPHPLVVGISICLAVLDFAFSLPLYLSTRNASLTLVWLGLPLIFGVLNWLAFWTETRRSRRDLICMTAGRLQQPLRIGTLGFSVEM